MTHYLSLTEPYERNQLLNEIVKVIKDYYPIGFDPHSDDYQSNAKYIRLKSKVDEFFVDSDIQQKSNLFIAFLKERYNTRIRGIKKPIDMSFGGEITLETYEDEFFKRKKVLRFNVGELVPFYTIYGFDETVVKLKDEKNDRELYYHAINVITVSPYMEFKEDFNYLKTKIESEFIGHKFIPFLYCSYLIEDVKLPFQPWADTTVYNTIFSSSLNRFYLPKIHLRGDTFYGILRF